MSIKSQKSGDNKKYSIYERLCLSMNIISKITLAVK